MIRRPPRSTLDRSSAASDVYKRQVHFVLHEHAVVALDAKVGVIECVAAAEGLHQIVTESFGESVAEAVRALRSGKAALSRRDESRAQRARLRRRDVRVRRHVSFEHAVIAPGLKGRAAL